MYNYTILKIKELYNYIILEIKKLVAWYFQLNLEN